MANSDDENQPKASIRSHSWSTVDQTMRAMASTGVKANQEVNDPKQQVHASPIDTEQQFTIKGPEKDQEDWQRIKSELDKCLDVFTYREAIELIDELVRLKDYLNSEFELIARGEQAYCKSKQEIIDFIGNLKVKNCFMLLFCYYNLVFSLCIYSYNLIFIF
jgi:hypothetical protein